MTISSTVNVSKQVGNAVTTAFSFSYLVFDESHFKAYLDGVLTSAYTLSGIGDPAGVTCTFDSAPGNGVVVLMARIVPLDQQTDLANFDGNPADVLEKQFDLTAMALQQVQEELDRSIKVSLGNAAPSDAAIDAIEALALISDEIEAVAAVDAAIQTAADNIADIQNAASNASAAASSASNASTSATLASNWATKTDGQVASTDYSAKAYAVGGTGTTTNNAKYYAEQAAASAAGVSLPSITSADAFSQLMVTSDGTGYELVRKHEIYSAMHSTPRAFELPLNGSTLAKTSGGTYNGTQYEHVYKYLWDNIANGQAAVAGGRGASAQADFDANKTITLPDGRNRSMIGVSGGGIIGTVAATAGAATVTPTGSITINAFTPSASQNVIHAHAHQMRADGAASSQPNGTINKGTQGSGSVNAYGIISSADVNYTWNNESGGSSITPTGSFSGSASSVVQPSMGVYWYITI